MALLCVCACVCVPSCVCVCVCICVLTYIVQFSLMTNAVTGLSTSQGNTNLIAVVPLELFAAE